MPITGTAVGLSILAVVSALAFWAIVHRYLTGRFCHRRFSPGRVSPQDAVEEGLPDRGRTPDRRCHSLEPLSRHHRHQSDSHLPSRFRYPPKPLLSLKTSLQPFKRPLAGLPSLPPAVRQYGVFLSPPLIMGLATIGKMFPIPFYNGRIEVHLNPTMRKFWKEDGNKKDETLDEHGDKVLTLSGIIHHRNTNEGDLLPWGKFPMHEIISQDPAKLWAEIKEYIRNQY